MDVSTLVFKFTLMKQSTWK
jgi:hypothetical protein